jgi:hypothetical protein
MRRHYRRGGGGSKDNDGSTPIPAHMLDLFQKFIASMGGKEEAKVTSEQLKNKEVCEQEKRETEEPPKEAAESSAQGAARGMSNNSGLYCYRCLTRGHAKEECSVTLFCDICESASHVKGSCPLLKKAKNTYAMTCGYAVDGLGFYYIPHSVAVRSKSAARLAMVRVVEGEMTASQARAEMERLVPAKMSWAVEEIVHNKFKTVFPSRGEMQRMIEWGLVHKKDRKAMLIIKELGGGSHVKQVMRKVWVQMTRLPSELRDFLTIWAVGKILGVTKDVDMSFTR